MYSDIESNHQTFDTCWPTYLYVIELKFCEYLLQGWHEHTHASPEENSSHLLTCCNYFSKAMQGTLALLFIAGMNLFIHTRTGLDEAALPVIIIAHTLISLASLGILYWISKQNTESMSSQFSSFISTQLGSSHTSGSTAYLNMIGKHYYETSQPFQSHVNLKPHEILQIRFLELQKILNYDADMTFVPDYQRLFVYVRLNLDTIDEPLIQQVFIELEDLDLLFSRHTIDDVSKLFPFIEKEGQTLIYLNQKTERDIPLSEVGCCHLNYIYQDYDEHLITKKISYNHMQHFFSKRKAEGKPNARFFEDYFLEFRSIKTKFVEKLYERDFPHGYEMPEDMTLSDWAYSIYRSLRTESQERESEMTMTTPLLYGHL